MHGLFAGGLGLTLFGRFPLPGVASSRALAQPGTLPDPSKPEGTDLLPQIEHIVVLMMENHSFDHYFGVLGRGDGLTLDAAGVPLDSNPDANGDPVRIFYPGTTNQAGFNVRLAWNHVFRQANGGAMDGFVTSSGLEAMTYFTADDIPFYHSLARGFPLCDRYFCSVPAATYPNRRFLTAGTAAGLSDTDVQAVLDNPAAPNGTIYERLDAFGISWANFHHQLTEVLLWPDYHLANEAANQDRIRPMHEFYERCRAGTLPAVSFITPDITCDEHPPQDISCGEQFSAGVIRELMDSPAWERSVLVYTYDEHGGFYDHVAPPAAVAPGDGIPPIVDGGPDPGAETYDRYGMRVPTVVVSPFSRPNYVSSVVHDHTSILRLIATKWNLGALTNRDANASNLLDCLDLSNTPPVVEPPSLEPPADGWPDIDRVIRDSGAGLPTPPTLTPHPEPARPVVATPDFTG
jgi:phospholipase C